VTEHPTDADRVEADEAAAPTPADETPTTAPATGRDGLGDTATGDIVIDSALQDLRDAPDDDLDAQIEAGQRGHRTLQGRLSDLGGE
jgi:DNA polymerase-3 subunit gamma/tau